MKRLRMLYLEGNPLTLVRGYVELLKAELPNIKFLDGKLTRIEKDIGQDAQIKTYKDLLNQQHETIEFANNPEKQNGDLEGKVNASKSDIMSSRSSKDLGYGKKLTNMMKRNIDGDMASDFESTSDIKLNITISVRTLENLKSIALEDEIASETATNQTIEKTQSLFWFEFNFFGNKLSTADNKIPHSKTLKQEKDDLFDLDFSFSQNYNFNLTADLYKNVMKGFVVEVYHSQPQKLEPVEGQEEQEIQTIVKEELLGFVIVSLDDFIKNNSLTTLRKKLPLFEEKEVLKHPNAYFPLSNEKEMIDKNKDEIEKIKKSKEPVQVETEQAQTTKKDAGKKAPGKPDPKKKDPKSKDATKVEEAPTVPQLNWAEDPRNIIVTKGDHLGRKDFKNDKKFFVATKPILAVQVSFS